MQILVISAALGSSLAVTAIGPDGIVGFAEKFGITAALLLYFVIRDAMYQKKADLREEGLITRIRSLEEDQKDTLIKALDRSSAAMEGCLNRQMASGIRRALQSTEPPSSKHG